MLFQRSDLGWVCFKLINVQWPQSFAATKLQQVVDKLQLLFPMHKTHPLDAQTSNRVVDIKLLWSNCSYLLKEIVKGDEGAGATDSTAGVDENGG